MPLHTTYADPECSVAGALDLIGGRWTLLIVRELFVGVHRFDEIQADLGVARNVLQDRPPRFGYHLTEAGLELWPALVALMRWGDRHVLAEGATPAVVLTHRGCGGELDGHLMCERCGDPLGPRDVWARPGHGVSPEHPLRRRLARAGAGEGAAGH